MGCGLKRDIILRWDVQSFYRVCELGAANVHVCCEVRADSERHDGGASHGEEEIAQEECKAVRLIVCATQKALMRAAVLTGRRYDCLEYLAV